MVQAGAIPISTLAYPVELQRDWARQETVPAVLQIFESTRTRLRQSHSLAVGYAGPEGRDPVGFCGIHFFQALDLTSISRAARFLNPVRVNECEHPVRRARRAPR